MLISLLGVGRSGVRSSYDLSRELGVNQRAIGFMVSNLRQQGYLIGSVHGEGYFLINTQEELDSTINHIARRKAGIDRTIKALTGAWEMVA